MRVPLSWLREFVPISEPPDVLVERLPMLGLGVEQIEVVGGEAILDLEVAANRPDLLSVLGIAREIAAAWGLQVTPPPVALREAAAPARAVADVAVEDPAWCPRYVAHVITGIRVGPSPLWMVQRLEAAGIRSINNVVDVTNYVMLEQGEPLHAFDLDRLAAHRIVVRRARRGERLATLDGMLRTLDEEMLVIADAERAVAVAGVMGGSETEIGPGTDRVLLEAAAFAGASVRRTSRRLGLRTESSARFERGLDPRIILDAARRTASLLTEVAGGQILAGVIDVYPRPVPPRVITLRLPRIPRLLGTDVPVDRVEAILRRLGCQVTRERDRLTVTVPAGRVDLEREEDLIEEVARHHGYDRIPETMPVEAMQPGSRVPVLEAEEAVRAWLIRAGLSEALTLSLIDPEVYDRLELASDDPARRAVPVTNPLLADHSHLRTMILPGLLEAMRVNLSRRVEDIHFFELGRTFHGVDHGAAPDGVDNTAAPNATADVAADALGIGPIKERRTLALAMRGCLLRGAWNLAPEEVEVTFFHLKGILESLLEELRLDHIIERAVRPWLHPGRSARLLHEGAEVGVFGELHPLAVDRFELTGRVYVAEIDLEALLPQAVLVRQFTALPRFPAVERDLSVIVDAGVVQSEVARIMQGAAGDLLESAELFDLYAAPPVPPGHHSLAYALRFRAPDRTLTSAEVDAIMVRIRDELHRGLGARPRE
jgi:phenylalanyl-tRNA synthetase beta chain